MIYSLERTDIVAIEDDFTLKLVPVLLDLVMLHHDDYHIDIGEELVEVVELVLDDVFLDEGIIDLERAGKVTLQHLEQL